MVKPKTIVLWGGESILGSSLEFFLAAQENWKVIPVLDTGDPNVLVQAVKSLRPEIVIVSQNCHTGLADFPVQIFSDYPWLKVITVSLEDNLVDIYTKQRILVKEVTHLILAIDNDLNSSESQLQSGKGDPNEP